MQQQCAFKRGIPAAPTMIIGMGMEFVWPWRVVTIVHRTRKCCASKDAQAQSANSGGA